MQPYLFCQVRAWHGAAKLMQRKGALHEVEVEGAKQERREDMMDLELHLHVGPVCDEVREMK